MRMNERVEISILLLGRNPKEISFNPNWQTHSQQINSVKLKTLSLRYTDQIVLP